MKREKLDDLRKATQVRYLEEHAKIAKILTKESSITNALRRLDEQKQMGAKIASGDEAMKAIGADLLWNTWQHSTRQRLNMELAQVRAQKLELMSRVRLAFGRDQAIQKLVEQKKQESSDQKSKRNEARILGWT